MIDNNNYQVEDREEDSQNNGPASFNSLSKERKIAAGLLGIFAVIIIVIWFSELKNNLDPLARIKKESASKTNNVSVQEADSEENLRIKDSDGDGLSDWDELNLYKTSPYLEDSDSDGFNDKNEINSGNDPNCPTGRNCSGVSGLDNSNLNDNSGFENLTQNILDDTANNALDQATTLLNAPTNANTLRQILLDSGFDRVALDKISDEDLIKAYQVSVKNQQ